MSRRIFQLGYPSSIGGAGTECWHTVRLWREAGWDVTLIPTWEGSEETEQRLTAIGAVTVRVTPAELAAVPGLPGSMVVGMCNCRFTEQIPRLRKLGCRLVWLPCMNWLSPAERFIYGHHGGPPDAVVFQSQFQRSVLEKDLVRLKHDPARSHLVRGALFFDEFPYRPARRHAASDPFVIGRLSRPDPDKWHSETLKVYASVNLPDRRALLMGVDARTRQKIGLLPSWAEALEPGAVASQEFLSRCHCLLPINDEATKENWPRVGLEAMAAGVPLIVENQGGWREMIEDGLSGFLCNSHAEMVQCAEHLARCESDRIDLAETAYSRMRALTDQETLTAAWHRIFSRVESGYCNKESPQ